MSKPKVVVVGSSNTDMIVKLDKIPVPGETVIGGEFSTASGGKGANQAPLLPVLVKICLVSRP